MSLLSDWFLANPTEILPCDSSFPAGSGAEEMAIRKIEKLLSELKEAKRHFEFANNYIMKLCHELNKKLK